MCHFLTIPSLFGGLNNNPPKVKSSLLHLSQTGLMLIPKIRINKYKKQYGLGKKKELISFF